MGFIYSSLLVLKYYLLNYQKYLTCLFQKYYVKHNEQQLQQLDDSIASLYDQQDAINQISSSDRSQSL